MTQNIKKNIDYKNIQALLAEKKNDISLAQFMKGVNNVTYAMDKNFTGKSFMDIEYMDVMSNNNLCALKKGGIVQVISPTGKKINEFKPEKKGVARSLAVDQNNHIYVMDMLFTIEKVKTRGRIREVKKTAGLNVLVYNSKGDKLREFPIAKLKTGPGVKVSGNKLILSDMTEDILGIFDARDGKLLSKIEGLSSCCGILDFDVNEKNEILVANLSAFRVNSYDLDGNIKLTFGNRGRDILDFHGCCNPVCVASLSNGAIVTAEKDPTRIKVYSKDGAKQIEGIDELVKGCTYIPMTVDSNDNLYLASPSKGIVKCIVTN